MPKLGEGSTPGPYTTCIFDEDQLVLLGPAYDGGKREPIATVWEGRQEGRKKANARLLVKAWLLPELAEALRYWLPDETMAPKEGVHKEAWYRAVDLLAKLEEEPK